MTTALTLIVAAAAVTVACALVVWRFGRHRGPSATELELTQALGDLNARMSELSRDLAGALEQVRVEERRSRALVELAGSIDLDEVLTRTLEAATNVRGVEAALVSVRGVGGEPVTAALGLSDVEAEHASLAGPPDGSHPRAIRFTFVQEQGPAETGLRAGLAVPLTSDDEELGRLAAYTRSDEGLGDQALGDLEALAARAGPAIDNARRFREARQLADLDALTGLHNRRYFHETLAREVARASRYGRQLSLVVLDLDDFKSINDRIGHLAGDGVLAEAAERVRDVVRSADVACRVGGDEFAIILPESGIADAENLYRRLQAALAKRPVGQVGRLAVSAGVAELLPTDDAVAFFERADEALYAAKGSGKGTVHLAAASDDPPPPTPIQRPAN